MMKRLHTAAAMLCLTTFLASAQEQSLSGKWEVRFLGPSSEQPTTFQFVELEFKFENGKLSGTGRAGDWPGIAPLSDIRVIGNLVSFTMIGKRSATPGFPRLDFDGTVQGNKMALSMAYGYVGAPPSSARRYAMEARRISLGVVSKVVEGRHP
jgi:hypothetical protein